MGHVTWKPLKRISMVKIKRCLVLFCLCFSPEGSVVCLYIWGKSLQKEKKQTCRAVFRNKWIKKPKTVQWRGAALYSLNFNFDPPVFKSLFSVKTCFCSDQVGNTRSANIKYIYKTCNSWWNNVHDMAINGTEIYIIIIIILKKKAFSNWQDCGFVVY